MFALLLIFVLLPFYGSCADTWDPHYISCTGFPEGYHEYGCWGKAICVNGNPVVTKCNEGDMYDRASDSCVSASQQLSSTACNTVVDCTSLTGRYADLGNKCRSYYICIEGAFFGRMYCPPSTVFNQVLQICDYLGHVLPPCGTYTGTYLVTPNGPWPEYTNPAALTG